MTRLRIVGPDDRKCICPPDDTGEARDFHPDCEVHGTNAPLHTLEDDPLNPHDPAECDAGAARLREQRDAAREQVNDLSIAIGRLTEQLEAERNRTKTLTTRITRSSMVNAGLVELLIYHGIKVPDADSDLGVT